MRMLVLLGWGLGVALLTMTLVWLASVRLRNAGIVDVAWSAIFAVLAALYAILVQGGLRQWLAAGMMMLWSIRLASHLGRRVFSHLETEDGRYARLRESWGESANRKMLLFFLFQGVTNVALSLPMVLVALDPVTSAGVTQMAGLALWGSALLGESVADSQLQRFKSDPANRGHVCQQGLWYYSRHPNYFFEWLIWCGFFVYAIACPHGWLAVLSPLLMLWFLYKVTGIPATEEQSVRSRGEEYREYQRTTSPFVPWPRRRSA